MSAARTDPDNKDLNECPKLSGRGSVRNVCMWVLDGVEHAQQGKQQTCCG